MEICIARSLLFWCEVTPFSDPIIFWSVPLKYVAVGIYCRRKYSSYSIICGTALGSEILDLKLNV